MIDKVENGLVTMRFTPHMCARLVKLIERSDMGTDAKDIDDALAAVFHLAHHLTTAQNHMLREDYKTYLGIVKKGD